METKSQEVREHAEVIGEAAEEEHAQDERFRSQVAIWIAGLAILLAIAAFNTAVYVRAVINTNIHANSDETLLHIKKLELKANELAADELRVSLAVDKKQLPPAGQAMLQQEIDRYQSEMARLESDPATKEGMKELGASMHDWEAKHEAAEAHVMSFESAEIIYQMAIVLCSVCIVLKRRALLGVALAFGAAATLLLTNGFLLIAHW